MPEVFNYLGMYLTQAGNYDAAYEAFDSVLELDPIYNYAYLNRGITLYYVGRYRLAQDGLRAFYRDDPNDLFSARCGFSWSRKIDDGEARNALQSRYVRANKGQWEWNIVEFYLGTLANRR